MGSIPASAAPPQVVPPRRGSGKGLEWVRLTDLGFAPQARGFRPSGAETGGSEQVTKPRHSLILSVHPLYFPPGDQSWMRRCGPAIVIAARCRGARPATFT